MWSLSSCCHYCFAQTAPFTPSLCTATQPSLEATFLQVQCNTSVDFMVCALSLALHKTTSNIQLSVLVCICRHMWFLSLAIHYSVYTLGMYFTVLCDSRGTQIHKFTLLFIKGKSSNRKLLYNFWNCFLIWSPFSVYLQCSLSLCLPMTLSLQGHTLPPTPPLFSPSICPRKISRSFWLWSFWTEFHRSFPSIYFPSGKTAIECWEVEQEHFVVPGLQVCKTLSLQPPFHSKLHAVSVIFRGKFSSSFGRWRWKG